MKWHEILTKVQQCHNVLKEMEEQNDMEMLKQKRKEYLKCVRSKKLKKLGVRKLSSLRNANALLDLYYKKNDTI